MQEQNSGSRHAATPLPSSNQEESMDRRARLIRRSVGIALAGALVPALMLGSGRADGPTFGAPVRLTGCSGSEPVIEIGPDGTVFASPIPGLPVHSSLCRSISGGASFSSISFTRPYDRLPGGGDSDVAVGSGGRVYFLDLWAGSSSIAVSYDNGSSWTQGTPFTSLPLTDRQWIALGRRMPDGKDTVYVVYHFIQPPQWFAFSRSRDGGLTWDWHTVPVMGVGAVGSIVADGDFVGFTYSSPSGHQYFAYSTDAGATWKRVTASLFQNGVGDITSVAIDPDNPSKLYIAYVSRFDRSVEVVRSTDRGQTWGLPVTVATNGMSNVFAWVAARNGKVGVAWYAGSRPGVPDSANGAWKVRYAESLDHGVTFGPDIEATGVVKNGSVCTSGLACNNVNREFGDFINIAIDAAGKSLIAFVRVTGGGASVVKQV
jgi:hypothetical protein